MVPVFTTLFHIQPLTWRLFFQFAIKGTFQNEQIQWDTWTVNLCGKGHSTTTT